MSALIVRYCDVRVIPVHSMFIAHTWLKRKVLIWAKSVHQQDKKHECGSVTTRILQDVSERGRRVRGKLIASYRHPVISIL